MKLTDNWSALCFALSMPYNNNLMDNLKKEVAKGKEFVTISFKAFTEERPLVVANVYASDDNRIYAVLRLGFETKKLANFIDVMESQLNEKLSSALLSNPMAVGAATKLSHNPRSKQFLTFCLQDGGIYTPPWITHRPDASTYLGMKNESCSVTEFRAWRRSLFEKRKNANVQMQ